MAKRYGKEADSRRTEVRNRRQQRIKKHIQRRRTEMELAEEEMKRIADTTYYTVMPYYMKNAAINIERGLRREAGVVELLEDFKARGGGPVVIVGGGPSLELNGLLDQLSAVYKERRFRVVAVDAVLEKLCQRGMYPDYVISTDVQEETLNFYLCVKEPQHAEGLKAAGTGVVLAGTMDPKVVDIVRDMPKYWYWPVARFGKHMDAGSMWNYMVPLGKVNPHGHVTGAALSIFAGADDPGIALIGADYCYPPGETYENTFWYKWLSARGRSHQEIMDDLKPQVFQDGVTGEEVMTDAVWMHYMTYMLNWLEAINPPLRLVNCSGRGLFYHPQLVPYTPFEDFITFAQSEEIADGEDNIGGGGPAPADG